MHTDLIARVARLERLLEEKNAARPSLRSVADFCQQYGISRSFFYKLGISYVKVGSRSFVTREAEDSWLASLTRTDESTKMATGN